MGMLRILAERDVRAVLDTATALDIARRTLVDQAGGGSRLSTPSAMVLDASPVGGPKFKFKAAAVRHLGASGIRLLAHPAPTPMTTANYTAVYRHGGYEMAGLVSDHWLSRLRTAAFGAVTAQALARPGPLVVSLFGTGGISAEIVPMLAHALPMTELRVTSRRAESMAAFVNAHAETLPCPLLAESDARRATLGADLVITLTESPSPLILPGMLAPGAVVCSMGSYNEVDFAVLTECDRFVVDDVDFAAEMGAARLAGVDEVYRIGGAQAIAALAYGTETIPPVDKITGPGNAFVAAAKRRVFGKVGIDMIAGPSEILVIADGDNDPDWIALDLLSQAEHDESAQSILVTPDAGFAARVVAAVEARLETLERRTIAGASWRDFGAVIVCRDLAEAAALSNRVAPEHLELCVADPEALSEKITHAGAIFLGAWTPEAIGDYVGGPNHVLPTARSARFSSGLSVMEFLKRTTIAKMTPEALAAIGPAAERLARSESLEAHGLSVTARLAKLNR